MGFFLFSIYFESWRLTPINRYFEKLLSNLHLVSRSLKILYMYLHKNYEIKLFYVRQVTAENLIFFFFLLHDSIWLKFLMEWHFIWNNHLRMYSISDNILINIQEWTNDGMFVIYWQHFLLVKHNRSNRHQLHFY